jgi:hypothetical protein
MLSQSKPSHDQTYEYQFAVHGIENNTVLKMKVWFSNLEISGLIAPNDHTFRGKSVYLKSSVCFRLEP